MDIGVSSEPVEGGWLLPDHEDRHHLGGDELPDLDLELETHPALEDRIERVDPYGEGREATGLLGRRRGRRLSVGVAVSVLRVGCWRRLSGARRRWRLLRTCGGRRLAGGLARRGSRRWRVLGRSRRRRLGVASRWRLRVDSARGRLRAGLRADPTGSGEKGERSGGAHQTKLGSHGSRIGRLVPVREPTKSPEARPGLRRG